MTLKPTLGTAAGEQIPCSAHEVCLELVGESAENVDRELILHAVAGVLHYFKTEKSQQAVSLKEFGEALERVLGWLATSGTL